MAALVKSDPLWAGSARELGSPSWSSGARFVPWRPCPRPKTTRSDAESAQPAREFPDAPEHCVGEYRGDVINKNANWEVEMALSDQLTKLATRAKEAEDRAAAAQGKARADVERDVENARTSAQEQADKLRATADTKKGNVSVWWHDMQRSWHEHIERIRSDIEERRAEHDADRAQSRAENAEDDATFAIDFAYAAIEEAEYAVLDASLARMEADELAAAPTNR